MSLLLNTLANASLIWLNFRIPALSASSLEVRLTLIVKSLAWSNTIARGKATSNKSFRLERALRTGILNRDSSNDIHGGQGRRREDSGFMKGFGELSLVGTLAVPWEDWPVERRLIVPSFLMKDRGGLSLSPVHTWARLCASFASISSWSC